METLTAETEAPSVRRQSRRDLALGIFLGLILGLAVISAFVFLGSEGAVDAPRISGVDTGKPAPNAVPAQRETSRP